MSCQSCRVLVRRARKLAQQYYLVYQEPIPTGQLVQRVASVMQEYTQSGWVCTKMQWYTSHLRFRGELYLLRSFTFNLRSWFIFLSPPPVECVRLVFHCSSLDGMKTTPTYSSLTPLYVVLLTFIIVLKWKFLRSNLISNLYNWLILRNLWWQSNHALL